MTFIIAEIGSSPSPEWNLEQWCRGVMAVGANAIKCQLFRAEHFPYNEQADKRRLEFPRERYMELVRCGRGYGLSVGASVFDAEAVRLACVGDFIKLAAREQSNTVLMSKVYDLNFHGEIYRSVSDTAAIHQVVFGNETTLWTVQKYPVSLPRAFFEVMRAAFIFKTRGLSWGWSSHSQYAADCVLAARLGASVIEKHFSMSADDIEAGHSLTPSRFAWMVRAICSLKKGQ